MATRRAAVRRPPPRRDCGWWRHDERRRDVGWHERHGRCSSEYGRCEHERCSSVRAQAPAEQAHRHRRSGKTIWVTDGTCASNAAIDISTKATATGTANSDGNGFKLGNPTSLAAGGNAAHKLISCLSFDNRAAGFTSNGSNSGKITCTNCGVWGDGVAWSPGTGGVAPQHTGDITNLTVTVDRAMNAPRDANGDLPDITKL